MDSSPAPLLNIIVATGVFVSLFLCVVHMCTQRFSPKRITYDWSSVFLYFTLFSLFGATGEVFLNTLYKSVFDEYLWVYTVYPVHNGMTSGLFMMVWGSFGLVRYITDQAFLDRPLYRKHTGIITSIEGFSLELLVNWLFFAIFGGYFFYYFPADLGPLSHLSSLQVIPFYFVFGRAISKLIDFHRRANYPVTLLKFYWMIAISFVYFT